VFGDKVLRGLNGETTYEYAYVQSQLTEVPFFASRGETSALMEVTPLLPYGKGV